MTYYELFIDAVHKLNFNKITIGEYEEMIEPLKREINQQPCEDWKFYFNHGYAQAKKDLFCEDCISRQAVLDKKNLVELDDGQSFYCINPKEVKTLPSVTPQHPRWIPVSERMPQKTDYYLIQYSREVCPDEMAVAFYSVEEAELDSNYSWEFKPIADCKEVIAWQPLPELYEERGRK